MPSLNINLKARHVLVVARGKNYKEDLKAIRSYIDEVNPVKIGVDGGADALLEFGWNPDIIVGDMDSVSDIALVKCKQRIVHAYLMAMLQVWSEYANCSLMQIFLLFQVLAKILHYCLLTRTKQNLSLL